MKTCNCELSHNSRCRGCRGIPSDPPVWMSEVQLAHYWSLFDENGEPLVGEIRAWSARPVEENRLMYAVMGGHRRYCRPLADEWAWDELDLETDDDPWSASPERESLLPN